MKGGKKRVIQVFVVLLALTSGLNLVFALWNLSSIRKNRRDISEMAAFAGEVSRQMKEMGEALNDYPFTIPGQLRWKM